MMRWDPPPEAAGIAVISSRTFLCAGAIACRGLFVPPMGSLLCGSTFRAFAGSWR